MQARKTFKLNIFKPTGAKDKILTEELGLYHRSVNKALQQLHKLKVVDNTTEHKIYMVLKGSTKLMSKPLQKAVRQAIGIYSSAIKNKRTPPKHAHKVLLRYDKDCMTISKTTGGNTVFAITAAENKRIPLIVKPDGGAKRLQEHIQDGWRLTGIMVDKLNPSWTVFALLTKEIKVPAPKQGQPILAVDLGSVNLATVTLFKDGKFQPLGCFGTMNGLLGLKREKTLRKERVTKTAKKIVEIAKEHKAIIVMENLTYLRNNAGKGMKKKNANAVINKIPYAQMYHWVSHLAHLEGILVRRIKAYYTSQLCLKCGYIDKNNRHGIKFECKQCRYQNNADIVGSFNIAVMGALKLKILTRRSRALLRKGYLCSVRALVTRPEQGQVRLVPERGSSASSLSETPTGFSRSQGL